MKFLKNLGFVCGCLAVGGAIVAGVGWGFAQLVLTLRAWSIIPIVGLVLVGIAAAITHEQK